MMKMRFHASHGLNLIHRLDLRIQSDLLFVLNKELSPVTDFFNPLFPTPKDGFKHLAVSNRPGGGSYSSRGCGSSQLSPIDPQPLTVILTPVLRVSALISNRPGGGPYSSCDCGSSRRSTRSRSVRLTAALRVSSLISRPGGGPYLSRDCGHSRRSIRSRSQSD